RFDAGHRRAGRRTLARTPDPIPGDRALRAGALPWPRGEHGRRCLLRHLWQADGGAAMRLRDPGIGPAAWAANANRSSPGRGGDARGAAQRACGPYRRSVMAEGEPGEVLISEAMREAIQEPDVQLRDRGRHELRGVPGEWQLYAVETVSSAG